MLSDRVVQTPSASASHPHAMPGWIRQCAGCGTPDIHAVYPSASMLDRPSWRCGACGCGRHAAVHVPFDATECPAMRPSGWTA